MLISDIIIYAVLTMAAFSFVVPWLTDGKAAFAVREKNSLVMRLSAVGLITAVYMVGCYGMNAVAAPLLGAGILLVLAPGLLAGIIHALAFAALDILLLAVIIKGASAVMRNTVKTETFGSAVKASLLIIAMATIAQMSLLAIILSQVAR
ncbi:MAG: hypothetical protein IT343_03215 [Candidatus Melainabacteria bacterium]|nr:hypothetical protein [Candidatus Melainabacteria bacterium]